MVEEESAGLDGTDDSQNPSSEYLQGSRRSVRISFDVLEIVAPNRRRLRVDNARTVESFDIVAKADDHDPAVVIPIALSIWLHEPEPPNS